MQVGYRTKESALLMLSGLLPDLRIPLALAVLCCVANAQSKTPGVDRRERLLQITTWCVQLQGLEEAESRQHIANADVDLVVIEPTDTVRGSETVPIHSLIRAVKSAKGPNGNHRLCIAYLNIGQAEDYRTYWLPAWHAPTISKQGHPDFLITVDPDGWEGNFPVAYWRKEWRAILWGNKNALLDRVLAAGFDGIYMDWILGFDEPAVVRAAKADGIDAAAAMEELLIELTAYARSRQPGFLLIGQNAVDLVRERPRLLKVLDGIAQEDLSFHGSASAKWGDENAGGIPAPKQGPWSSRSLGKRLAAMRKAGLQVLTLDYALLPKQVAAAKQRSRRLGLVPFVTQTPLDRLPPTAESRTQR